MAAEIIDVRLMGAAGDGVTEDGAAFAAAFAAAGPAGVRVPPGLYRVSCDLACPHPVRFEGRLLQPADRRLALGAGLRLSDYLDAFGTGDAALRKAVAALFAAEGEATLDLCGMEVALDAPLRVDAAGAVGAKSLRRGRIALRAGQGWTGACGEAGPGAFALSVTGLGSAARLILHGVEWRLAGLAGALSAECAGGIVALRECGIEAAAGVAIRLGGRSGEAVALERCALSGRGTGVEAATGATVSGCRFEGVAPALVLAGRGNRFSGCRVAPGTAGLRPGLVLARRDTATQVADCDFDGASIRWDESAGPPFAARRDDFAGLSVTASRFTGRDLPRHARWIEVAPAGPGRSLSDLSVTGCLFACEGGGVERVEEARPALVAARMRRIGFSGNVHRGVERVAECPAVLQFRLPLAQRIWTLDTDGRLPFGVPPGQVAAICAAGPLRDGTGREVQALPVVETPPDGPARLRFPGPVAGVLTLTLRGDRPG